MTTALDDRDTRQIWSVPTEDVVHRIQWRFVLSTWAMAAGLSLVLIAAGTQIAYLLTDANAIVDDGIIYIIAVFTTFLVFVLVVSARLLHIDSDRFLNSMSVAAFHTSLALVLALVGVAIGANDELGASWIAFERAAAASIVACLLAAAIIPARGPLPYGTQTDLEPTDRQL